MVTTLKEIAKFSDDLVAHCIGKLPELQRTAFEETLKTIRKDLGHKHKPAKKMKKHEIPDSKTLFLNDVVKLIKSKLEEFESRINKENGEVINVLLDFPTDFGTMSLEEQVNIHKFIIELETDTLVVQNVLKYYKGSLYFHMKKNHNRAYTLKNWFHGLIKISYSTILRYINLYFLAVQFPRILVCLNFSQLQKHHTRIIKYLSNDQQLANRLSIELSFLSGGHEVLIKCENNLTVTVPNKNIIRDADEELIDSYLDSNEDFEYTDEEELDKSSDDNDTEFLDAESEIDKSQ